MTKVDQFESVFRSAIKEVYSPSPIEVSKILQVTDLEGKESEAFGRRVRSFLHVLGDEPEWVALGGGDFGTVAELLEIIQREGPSLICTYRNLRGSAWQWPYSLGEYLDLMTQIAPCPVLVLPHPHAGRSHEHALVNTDIVAAVTDHLAGDSSLVDYAVHFTHPGGKLFLAHIEDETSFERLMDAISKIPSIETDSARETIRNQLMKEPEEYVDSCRVALDKAGIDVTTESVVVMGDELASYKVFITDHDVDLLVFHTKDHDQLAMHGRAYAFGVTLLFSFVLAGLIASLALEEKIHAKKSVIAASFAVVALILGARFHILPFGRACSSAATSSTCRSTSGDRLGT